jgi:cytochrome oxidase Cu insertion factor (SCO1/SenC/PrrC family)
VNESEPRRRRGQRQFWILVAVFFAPLALAFLLYYGAGWRPGSSTNRGDLIHPARPLPAVTLRSASGAALDANALHGKWTLLYAGDGACDARCREALALIRQTRLALGDDMARVQRVFLATAHCCDLEYLQREHPGLITANADDPAGRELLASFPDSDRVGALGRIYVVDPLGNLMMSYAPDAPRRGLLDDMKKLLKLSHVG